MKPKRIVFHALVVLALAVGAVTSAHAQAQRTFVSTSGNDANTASLCSNANPCRHPTAAQTVTNVGGEIVFLTSGGYSQITITKGLSLIGTGVGAALSTPGGGNAITINIAPGGGAGGTRRVVLRDLRFQGLGLGTNGIQVDNVGTLYIQGCTIERFTDDGIHWDTGGPAGAGGGRLIISDTIVQENNGDGLFVDANDRTRVSVDDSRFMRNGGDGISLADGNIDASISDSVASENGSNGIEVDAGSGAEVAVTRTTAAHNDGDGFYLNEGTLNIQYCTAHRNGDDGMAVEGSGTIRVGLSTSTNNNGYGFNNQAMGTFATPQFQRNVVEGNQTGQLNGGITTITPI